MKPLTPWRKVQAKFGLRPAQLAREIGCHRAKISRALKDEKGLINGDDQVRLLEAACRLNIRLTPADLTPEIPEPKQAAVG